MPEGPEIRLAADEVAAALVDRPVEAIYFAFDHLKAFEPILAGEVVTAVETRGKAILTRFANELNIYSHNQLYGKWMVRAAYDFPETNRQLRLAIHNADKSALLYSASEIQVLHDDELDAHPFLSRLGPDLLDPALTVADVAARYRAEEFQRRKLTTLLLDQRFLAGLGNYLRSEILFKARIDPGARPVDLSDEQIAALARATVELTRQSYVTRGITNDLELVQALQSEGWTRRRYRWWVFNRGGEQCHRCGGEIVQEEIGGRRLYYCANCQKR
jgi:endonuclease-8